ncbi:MAG TPA: histidine kinase dimerization/phosphoacceptor domain -containing protein [Actinomycetota bacterium]|nr:histidine kinase dimerization/phosphoacceptor domain -containing protein [Actinomycetota bacterium]
MTEGPFDINVTLARAIVDTVHEPLLVLNEQLRVVVASRSFYTTFQIGPEETQGKLLYDLSDGEWNIAALRLLLDRIVPASEVMEDFEVEQVFPRIGRRTMLLNARRVYSAGSEPPTILLAFEDITERRTSERALKSLLEQKDILLAEMSHRVANSLQIIASILLMKARNVKSDETRHHLEDAHRRVMSVASVQQHLQATGRGEQVEVGSYLSKLCETLSASMIGDNRRITVDVVAGDGTATSSQAVSLGLIVTELLINALKHAFPDARTEGHVIVGYEAHGSDWKLSVSDNGAGIPPQRPGDAKSGLGTSLIKALTQQIEAQIEIATGPHGTTVSVTHATFESRLPTVA